MHIKIRTLIFAILAFCSARNHFCTGVQDTQFRCKGRDIHPFTYTLNQDSHGYIWIGTGEGLCRFNGTDFNTDIQQDSLSREVAGTSFKDHTGALWFGYQSGNIARYTGFSF